MNRNAIIAILVAAVLVAAGCVYFVYGQNQDGRGGGGDEPQGGLPSAYDQRSAGIVTPVKNQNPWGTCWAFGGIGAAETSILTLLGMTYEQSKDSDYGAIDFSEKHLAWFATHAVSAQVDQRQAGEGLYNIGEEDNPNITYDIGGNNTNYSALFAMGIGPINEINFPYQGSTGLTALQVWSDPQTADSLMEMDCYNSNGMSWAEYIEEMRETEEIGSFFHSCTEIGMVFPDGTTADNLTADIYKSSYRDLMIKQYAQGNEYSNLDDWTLPELDEDGNPNRSMTSGFVMLEGLYLSSPSEFDDDGNWIGLNQKHMEDIKNELYSGHGLAISYHVPYVDEDYFCDDTASQFAYKSEYSNHEVQLVGWDDNYSRNNFVNDSGILPEGDGAWLCKNSWGSETDCYVGEDGYTYNYGNFGIKDKDGKHTGYFWISYYDRSFGSIQSLVFTNKISSTEGFNTHMYDYLPEDSGSYYIEGAVKGANVFTVSGSEEFAGISIETHYPDAKVTIKAVLLDDTSFNFEDGKVIFSAEKQFQFGGYHTILLDKMYHLDAGSKVSIIVEEEYADLDGRYLVGIHMGINEQAAVEAEVDRYCKSVVNPGESYVFADNQWYDLVDLLDEAYSYSSSDVYDNLSIKMFTIDTSALQPDE